MVLSFTESEEDSSLTYDSQCSQTHKTFLFFWLQKNIYHKLKFKKWLVKNQSNQNMENQQVSRLIRTGPVNYIIMYVAEGSSACD